MPAKKKALAGGRYDLREITLRVTNYMKKKGVQPKEIYNHFGWDRSTWTIKVGLKRSSFSIPELGVIADYLHAPTGWPFLSDGEGELLDGIKMKSASGT